jgi:hypothetical protein
MATAKKKASAKRTVKYAAKAQSSARQTSQPAAAKAASWVNSGSAAEWQKGAQDWAKQSAKLYQLPFAQGDVGAATQQAAEQVKSATENMVKMSSDMMNQMFAQGKQAKASAGKAASAASFDPAGYFKQFQSAMPAFEMPSFDMASMFKQLPQMPAMPAIFDVASAQDKLSSFTKDSSDQLAKASKSAQRTAAEAQAASREHIEVLTEVANVATTVSKELGAEIIGYLNKQFAQNVELSKQVLSCRTLNDMFDLSNRISKTNLDAFFSQSVKLSEMIFQCATDISEPLNDSVSDITERLTKAISH